MLFLNLLGSPQILDEGKPVLTLTSVKSQALLYYLAVTRRPYSRLALGGLLWAEKGDDEARVNVRQAVKILEKTIPGCLIKTRHTVAINPARVRTDVALFETAVSKTPTSIADKQQAADLYTGDFLDGFYVNQAAEFEQWLVTERERLRGTAVQLYHDLSHLYLRQRNTIKGLIAARRLLTLEPWREDSHRLMMRLLAWDGQWSAALTQYKTCQNILKTELDINPSLATEQLYQRILALRQTPRPSLPEEATPLVGRANDIITVSDMVCTSSGRLVTITGQGGMGKSRLALAVGKKLANVFLEGVFWIDLTGVTSADDMLTAIGNQMNLPSTDKADPFTHLMFYLKKRECLLLLDNFEQLLSNNHSLQLLLDLLQASPGLFLLITSRVRLNMRREAVYSLHRLAYPDAELPTQFFSQTPYPAVELFAQTARRVDPHFQLEPVRNAVNTICKLLAGLPLGIELAASLVQRHTCHAIAEAIARDLDNVSTDMVDVLPRQRGLRMIFDYSWHLLSEIEQYLLAALSTFQGHFTVKAANQIISSSARSLEKLCRHSLLRFDATQERYSLHEVIRFYASERLNGLSIQREVWAKYTTYFLHYLSQQESALMTAHSQPAVRAIQKDFANFTQAWRHAVTTQRWHDIGQSLNALALYCDIGGHSREGLMLLKEAVATLKIQPHENGLILSRLLAEMARRHSRLGQQTQAIVVIQEASELAILVSDRLVLAESELVWSEILWHLGKYEEAEEHLQRALAYTDSNQTPQIELKYWHLSGNLSFVKGDFTAARGHFERALEISRTHQYLPQQATCLNNLAATCFHVAEYESARLLHEQALKINQEMGNQFGLALSLGNLADIYLQKGNFALAKANYLRSLDIRQKIGDALGEAWLLHALGNLCQQEGALAEAKSYYEQSLQLRRQNQNPREIAESLNSLGTMACLEKRYDDAAKYHREALAIYDRLGDQFSLATTHFYMAQLAVAQLDWHTAQINNKKAYRLFCSIEHDKGQTECLALQEKLLLKSNMKS